MILCGFCIIFSNNIEVYESNRNHYTGSIDAKYPIFMTLDLGELNVEGSYYYYSIGTHIDLKGTYANDGSFMINEFVNDECTGTFSGSFDDNRVSAAGIWTNASGTKNMPFSLEHIAGELTLEARQFDVTAHIPQFIHSSQVMQNLISDTINTLFDDFIESYESDMKNEPEWGWEFICDYTIAYYSDFFISILLEIYEHTGGVHGNAYYICLNAIEEKGFANFLKIDALFRDNTDYELVLSELLITELEKQEAAWIMDGSIQNIDADVLVYNVTPKGLLFTFAPYAVGPYAEGPHWVTLPYKKIKDIINPQVPIGKFLK